MTLEQARKAKANYLPVRIPLGMNDYHYGVIRQIGGHESGNDKLVAVQGQYELQWHHHLVVQFG